MIVEVGCGARPSLATEPGWHNPGSAAFGDLIGLSGEPSDVPSSVSL